MMTEIKPISSDDYEKMINSNGSNKMSGVTKFEE